MNEREMEHDQAINAHLGLYSVFSDGTQSVVGREEVRWRDPVSRGWITSRMTQMRQTMKRSSPCARCLETMDTPFISYSASAYIEQKMRNWTSVNRLYWRQ